MTIGKSVRGWIVMIILTKPLSASFIKGNDCQVSGLIDIIIKLLYF